MKCGDFREALSKPLQLSCYKHTAAQLVSLWESHSGDHAMLTWQALYQLSCLTSPAHSSTPASVEFVSVASPVRWNLCAPLPYTSLRLQSFPHLTLILSQPNQESLEFRLPDQFLPYFPRTVSSLQLFTSFFACVKARHFSTTLFLQPDFLTVSSLLNTFGIYQFFYRTDS